MSYTPTEWKSGDVVTAAKLNHMEDGIADAGGTLVIGGFGYDNDAFSGTSDKTWQEIDNALAAGVRCVIVVTGHGGHKQLIVDETTVLEGNYDITAGMLSAATTSADGYPTIEV